MCILTFPIVALIKKEELGRAYLQGLLGCRVGVCLEGVRLGCAGELACGLRQQPGVRQSAQTGFRLEFWAWGVGSLSAWRGYGKQLC